MTITYYQNPPAIELISAAGAQKWTSGAYSGHGEGLNNPALEAVRCVGPIPRGLWRITRWLDHYPGKGPCVAILRPDGWDAYGRCGFLIHGDNPALNHSASLGCIIAPHDCRVALRASGDTALRVL